MAAIHASYWLSTKFNHIICIVATINLYNTRVNLFEVGPVFYIIVTRLNLNTTDMNIEQFQEYCLSLPGVTEEFPFGEEILVYKVKGKLFVLTHIDVFESINLKCDPEIAVELRERYEGVKPGYHMNKKHWNTVEIHSNIPDRLLYQWIKDSYDLVVKSLPKKDRESLL